MGALLDAYKVRYSSLLAVAASNPQDSTQTAQDATRQAAAETDVQIDFQIECGVTFDGSNSTHLAICIRGLHAKLLVYTGQADIGMYESWLEYLRNSARLVLGRDRVTPSTNSPLSATLEKQSSRPLTDQKVFGGYVPGSPKVRPTVSQE